MTLLFHHIIPLFLFPFAIGGEKSRSIYRRVFSLDILQLLVLRPGSRCTGFHTSGITGAATWRPRPTCGSAATRGSTTTTWGFAGGATGRPENVRFVAVIHTFSRLRREFTVIFSCSIILVILWLKQESSRDRAAKTHFFICFITSH